jgi:hypothetical protein
MCLKKNERCAANEYERETRGGVFLRPWTPSRQRAREWLAQGTRPFSTEADRHEAAVVKPSSKAHGGASSQAQTVRKMPSWARSWASLSLYSCVPTGMRGPTCIVWANLKHSSLTPPPRAFRRARRRGRPRTRQAVRVNLRQPRWLPSQRVRVRADFVKNYMEPKWL